MKELREWSRCPHTVDLAHGVPDCVPKDDSTDTRREVVIAFVGANPLCTPGELYDWLAELFPDVSRASNRGLVRRLYNGRMPWLVVGKSCPRCGKTAEGLEQCLKVFGTRYGGRQLQSYCKECR